MTNFEKTLNKLSLEDYRAFVLHCASQDPDFKIIFEIYFADKTDSPDIVGKYKKLMERLISKYSDHGCIDYRSTSDLSSEIDNFLEIGAKMVRQNNFRDGFLVASIVLKETINTIADCDDSGGCIGENISEAIELIDTICREDKAANDLKEEIFLFLEIALQDRVYFDYGDFGYDLFSSFRSLAVNLGKRESFLTFLEKQIKRVRPEAYSDYEIEFLIKERIAFYEESNEPEQAKKLIAENLDIVELRNEEVNRVLLQNDFEQAKILINEGIRIAEEKKHPGTVNQWKRALLHVAQQENDVPTIRHYTKYFAFERGFSNKDYRQWKATYSPTEWVAMIEEHIQKTIAEIKSDKTKRSIFYDQNTQLRTNLAPIYIEEQYLDRLMGLLQNEKSLDVLLTYHDHLKKQFPGELMALYPAAFEHKAERASKRKEYVALASTMKRVMKDLPEKKEEIMAVVRKLKEKYARRPAMLDELNRL